MYPLFNNNYLLKLDALSILVEPIVGKLKNIDNPQYFKINKICYDFIILCNGINTFDNIIERLKKNYNITSNQDIVKDIKQLLIFLEKNDILFINKTSNQKAITPTIIDSRNCILPTNISLEVTNNCQLKCKHCFNSYNKTLANTSYFIDYNDIVMFFKKCKQLNIQSIFITGGEPLLHHKIESILKHACLSFNKVTLATNGFIIPNNSICSYLKDINGIVQISIDGNEKYHNYLRGNHKSYQNAIKTLKKLVRNNIEVHISYTLNQENISFIENEIKYFKENGVSVFNIGSTTLTGNAKENNITSLSISDFMEKNSYLNDKYSTEYFKVGNNLNLDSIEKMNNSVTYNNKCGAGFKSIHVCSNGIIVPCTSMDEFSISSIKSKSLFLKNDLVKYLDIKTPTPLYCKDCTLNFQCGGCIGNMIEEIKNGKCKIYSDLNFL